jgi:hypothetical protein
MSPKLLRLPPALRKLPPQLLLAALVLLAALASGVVSHLGQRARGSEAAAPPAASPRKDDAATDEAGEAAALARPVEEAFEAARAGDLEAYLAQFAGSLRSELARTRAEKGDAYLRSYLARFTAPVKGLAVRASEKETAGPDLVRCPVEFVYSDRNEVQAYFLEREGDRWLIRRIDPVRAAQTIIPYGTPVEQVK